MARRDDLHLPDPPDYLPARPAWYDRVAMRIPFTALILAGYLVYVGAQQYKVAPAKWWVPAACVAGAAVLFGVSIYGFKVRHARRL